MKKIVKKRTGGPGGPTRPTRPTRPTKATPKATPRPTRPREKPPGWEEREAARKAKPRIVKTGGAAPVVYKSGGPTTKSVTDKHGTERSVTLPDLSKGRRPNRKAVATATKTKKNGKSVTISTTGIGEGKGRLGAHTKTKTKKDGTIKKVKKITLKKAGKAINKADKKIDAVKSKNLKKDIKKIKSNGRSTSIRTAPKMNLGGPGDNKKPKLIIKNGKIYNPGITYTKGDGKTIRSTQATQEMGRGKVQ